jgi:hypothetical protein
MTKYFYKGKQVKLIHKDLQGNACIIIEGLMKVIPTQDLQSDNQLEELERAYELVAKDLGVSVSFLKECLTGIDNLEKLTIRIRSLFPK